MKARPGLAAAILLIAGGLPALAQSSMDQGRPGGRFELEIDAATRAEVLVGEAGLEVTVHPGGVTQVLEEVASDEEGGFHFGAEDFNFDGYVDLSTWAVVGQVNRMVVVYLYDPADHRFHTLRMPDNAPVNCDGFWDLTPDSELRLLTSSCRGGPRWFTDVYRFTPRGDLYVYRSQRQLMSSITDRFKVVRDEYPIASVWTTYDSAGTVLETWVGTDPLRPEPLMVAVAAPFEMRDAPEGSVLAEQPVAGERVEVLDVSQDETWMKVRTIGPAKPRVTGWVAVPEEEASP